MFRLSILTVLALVLWPGGSHASSSPADSVHYCLPFDYEQWERENPRPAAKRAATLNVGEPRTVRLIYFLPNDLPFDQERVDLTKTMIRQVQTFFAEQMQAHGYGYTTFRFETDAAGDPLVHRVDGRHSYEYYHRRWSISDEISEIGQTFDLSENIYLINFVTDGKSGKGYGGRRSKVGGFGVGTIHGHEALPLDFYVFIHELGHAFGLKHDFRDDTYVMSYGYYTSILSACNARFLAVHPYFNADNPIEAAQLPAIELTSSLVRRKGVKSIPIRIKVSDSDGLHQVLLYASPEWPPPGGLRGYGLKECRSLAGEKEAVVEFDYDGDIPGLKQDGLGFGHFERHYLGVQAIDVLGNSRFASGFELVDEGYKRPIAVLEHGGHVQSVSFSPGGRLLATGGHEIGVANLWEVSTGKHVAAFPHSGNYWFQSLVTFSPDGKLLLTRGEDEVAFLWEVSTGERVARLEHGKTIRTVAFSFSGRLMATGGGGTVNLWEVSTSEHIAMLTTGVSNSVTFSPDGRLLAAGGRGTVILWDVSTRERVAMLPVEDANWTFDSVTFSPDGRLLAAGGNPWTPVVKLWNVSTRRSITTLSGKAPAVFSPDGRLIASIGVPLVRKGGKSSKPSHVVKLWNVSTGQSIASIVGGNSGIPGTMTFSSDGRLLAVGSSSGTIELWDTSEWTLMSTPPPPNPDFDGDGTVGIPDFLQFIEHFGLSQGDVGYDARYDLDGDGTIGIPDFLIFVNAFGENMS